MLAEKQSDIIARRFGALLGHGWRADFAEAIGVSRPTISVQFAFDKVPDCIVSNLEWMEANPLSKWPPRWAKLAERAKAKTKADQKKTRAA